jgi:hypothetical protein
VVVPVAKVVNSCGSLRSWDCILPYCVASTCSSALGKTATVVVFKKSKIIVEKLRTISRPKQREKIVDYGID